MTFNLQTAFSSEDYPLSLFYYVTYNETDFDTFSKAYGNPGFDKPNVTKYAKPLSQNWPTKLVGLYANDSKWNIAKVKT